MGAALGAVRHPDVRVTVIDIGGRLEAASEQARARLSHAAPSSWDASDIATITELPVGLNEKGLPEKRAFGSDFPFRDFGQRDGVQALDGINDKLVSGAYGGFSNAWGAQLMPFTRATFRDWPISSDEMYWHYDHVLQSMPFAAQEDDLASLFPLIGNAEPLPPLSPRSNSVLSRYAAGRERINRRGVVIGRARLAMRASACVRCGLCMTGCPYSLIYSASQTMDQLRTLPNVTYHDGLLAVSVHEDAQSATVVATELATGRQRKFTADRVLLACGAIGTARLVMGSLQLYDTPAHVAEACQFILPFVSRHAVGEPEQAGSFTLNQFNIIVQLDREGRDVAQLHFYTYNAAFPDALPRPLRAGRAHGLRNGLFRRFCVALGYLPSWASPGFTARAQPGSGATLPTLTLSREVSRMPFVRNKMLRDVLYRITGSAHALDLWPVLPALEIAAEGKSYHWGAVFPHSERPRGRFCSDVLGRVAPWRRIHLADSSVFPTVPATTFALTAMANAHRIADAALRELG